MESTPQKLRDVIKELMRNHLLDFGGLAMGQCLTAVGWVGGTLPELYEENGMIELSMADVAGSGFVVGAGLAGKRPIYIIRYQGFNWFNAPIIINYGCKSKELWGRPCPIFIRSIAMEGGIGPVAGSSHHALYYRMPGVKIYSPMTPMEYRFVYDEFMKNDDVFYVSEHRGSFSNEKELQDIVFESSDYVLCPISISRFAAQEASKELFDEFSLKISVLHIMQIKPFLLSNQWINVLKNSINGACILDDDYVDGIAKNIAFDMQSVSSCKFDVLGLDDRSAGFGDGLDNLPPNKSTIKKLILSKVGLK